MDWRALVIIGGVVAVVFSALRFRNPKIRGSALTGTAQVLSAQQAVGVREERGDVAVRVELRVQVPGREPYNVTVKRRVQLIHLPRVQTGASFPVQVDETNPQAVQIDFQPANPVAPQSN
jgi:hypothetical protein